MSKRTKKTATADNAEQAPKRQRKARTSSSGGPTKIQIATTMLLQGTTMKKIEEVTGDTSYAAIRKLESDGYTFDKSQRDNDGRIFYKAVKAQTAQDEQRKVA